jgi:hypothetical protein
MPALPGISTNVDSALARPSDYTDLTPVCRATVPTVQTR